MELWQRAQNGEAEAQTEAIRQFEKSIYAAIHKYAWAREDWDDLFQDGAETVLHCVREYRPERNVPFAAFVHTRIKYLFMNKNRERRMLSLDYKQDEEESLLDRWPDPSETQEEVFLRMEAAVLHEAISELTERERMCVTDFYFDGLSVTESAARQGIAWRTAYNSKVRGLKKLKTRLVNHPLFFDRRV